MAIEIKHAFTSLKGDGGDATLVKPSHWNAAHSTTMATGNLLGRLTSGAGAFEEIPVSAYMAALFAAADKDALADALGIFETGDVKYTFKTTAAAGWVLVAAGGTIGNAASGATIRANADVSDLYVLIWDAVSDANAPVTSGRGANGLADFNAGKPMTIPQLVGRAPVGAGAAATGTSARTLGQKYGAETATLVTGNLPAYTPTGLVSSALSNAFAFPSGIYGNTPGAAGGSFQVNANTGSAAANLPVTGTVTSSFAGNAQGGTSTPLNIMQPVVALNTMVKL